MRRYEKIVFRCFICWRNKYYLSAVKPINTEANFDND